MSSQTAEMIRGVTIWCHFMLLEKTEMCKQYTGKTFVCHLMKVGIET